MRRIEKEKEFGRGDKEKRLEKYGRVECFRIGDEEEEFGR